MARSIEVVGKLFPTAAEFLVYLESLKFGTWRPRYVTVHHTGSPTLVNWRGWQTRKPPVTDLQWLKNLGAYYAAPPPQGRGWNVGPHFFITPKNIGVLTPPTTRGIHAASFNVNSWGVEIVGNFDSEKFEGPEYELAMGAIAAMHVALGISPAPYEVKTRGLHFHRDDPLTNKTCPGKPVQKLALVHAIEAQMIVLTGGRDAEQHEDVTTAPDIQPAIRLGTVNTPANDPTLNVRADAGSRSPVVNTIKRGDRVKVIGEAMNGPTKWYNVGDLNGDGNADWVAAQFVKLD